MITLMSNSVAACLGDAGFPENLNDLVTRVGHRDAH